MSVVSACFASCSSGTNDEAVDTSEVYSVVIRWFVERSAADVEHPVVFLTSLGEGLGIGLDTQAAVVSATESFADARFVDDWSEALDDDGVRQDGLFLALGPVVEKSGRVMIECDRIRSDTDREGWDFELIRQDSEWIHAAEPVRS